MTTASWIRKFVLSHTDYKHDSVVSDKITYDLMRHMHDVSEGIVPCPELIGKFTSKTPKTYQVIDCSPPSSTIPNGGDPAKSSDGKPNSV